MKKCKECGQVIKRKIYYVGDCIDINTGAILLDKIEAEWAVGQFVLAIVPSRRIFYVWYLTEDNELKNGHYFMTIRQALEYFGRAK